MTDFEKPEVEKRWQWLAHLIASIIVTVFRIVESVLKAVFSLLLTLTP